MYNPYGLDPWSKLYRKEALREVSKRHLVKQVDRNLRMNSWLRRVGFALSVSLHVLKG